MADPVFKLHHGGGPLVVSLPHVGTGIPVELRGAYTPRALALEDTDWHLERLYEFATKMNITVISANVSRYVIDLNRPPDDAPMYPGAANTELCPTRFFTGEPLYREDHTPSPIDVANRRQRYWQPYHDALSEALNRVKAKHGFALLWDGHSIRSQIPWLFEGRLPDFNLGTASGASCDASLRTLLVSQLADQCDFTTAVDGRFKGGYITRRYGNPSASVHAVQMEMCQSLYMDEIPPFEYRLALAERVQPLLQRLLTAMHNWKPNA